MRSTKWADILFDYHVIFLFINGYFSMFVLITDTIIDDIHYCKNRVSSVSGKYFFYNDQRMYLLVLEDVPMYRLLVSQCVLIHTSALKHVHIYIVLLI